MQYRSSLAWCNPFCLFLHQFPVFLESFSRRPCLCICLSTPSMFFISNSMVTHQRFSFFNTFLVKFLIHPLPWFFFFFGKLDKWCIDFYLTFLKKKKKLFNTVFLSMLSFQFCLSPLILITCSVPVCLSVFKDLMMYWDIVWFLYNLFM